ncbi:MAG: MTH1187 family thiamine-binding protein [Salinivirgaceae bacterium]|nr:MTH1187 family thiamine-binding protein [Salinivirgaceae bacterium]
MMKNKINLALQVLPRAASKDSYALVDKAIEIIENSGVKYKVCPFETVLEGYYDELMEIVKKVHEQCYNSGTETMMTYIKIQSSAKGDVTIDDKMEKYQ